MRKRSLVVGFYANDSNDTRTFWRVKWKYFHLKKQGYHSPVNHLKETLQGSLLQSPQRCNRGIHRVSSHKRAPCPLVEELLLRLG